MASSTDKTDFLRFNCYSIKELITRKLAQDSKFTDQVYEGSNLAVLIDIVSYMFQCLAYQLNNAASESMFKDTQLYENMVRLVKFLDYNPRGCKPAQLNVNLQSNNGTSIVDDFHILPFAYINTKMTDQQGKEICFSLDDETTDLAQSNTQVSLALYNGKWKVCNQIFTASGLEYETFVLTEVMSYSKNNKYDANDFIRVYVYDENDPVRRYRMWKYDKDGVFITSRREVSDGSNVKYFTLYGNNSQDDYVYSITLNENHQYEIKFGDGNIGRKLNKGSKVFVLYLETNGYDGKIDIDNLDITQTKLQYNEDIAKLPYEMRKVTVYALDDNEDPNAAEQKMTRIQNNYTLTYNSGASTVIGDFKEEDSVDDIRQNAPNWFKTGYRLITKRDYEYFVKNNTTITNQLHGLGDIIDVKCMNNTEMVAKFYRWLYLNGLKRSESNGRYYFENDFFSRTGYSYVDPSDSNNIYLWIKSTSKVADDQIKTYNDELNNIFRNIKIMTTEIQYMNPITVNFDICSAPNDYVLQNYLSDTDDSFDTDLETTIEITLDDNQTYIGNNIQQSVYNIIVNAFNQNKILLGQKIDSVAIVNKIYEINGVTKVRTVWNKADSEYVKALDGLSFASWTDSNILTQHEDLQVGNSIRHIEDFQYPVFIGQANLMNRIKIIKKQMTTVNTIKF